MSLTTLAFERLRSDILGGDLRPAERLRIQALSERYEIGATAIREALSRLVTDGLVEGVDRRGFSVARISKQELLDLTRTRIDIESLALRRAIADGGVDWEGDLLSSCHRLLKTPLPVTPDLHDQWLVHHEHFHRVLIAGCTSPWLMRLCRVVSDQFERYRNLSKRHTAGYGRDALSEHRALMEAAMARDADRAAKLLREHYWLTADIVLRTVFLDAGGSMALADNR